MSTTPQLPLTPLAYHVEMIRHLQTQEADLWKWFCEDRLRAQQNEAVRLDLLKSTFRIERDASPALYAAADEVAAKLHLAVPITFYQSQDVGVLNAALAYIPGEGHVVLAGAVATALTPTELRWVLGHELVHFAMLDQWREFLVAGQLLAAMTNDAAAAPSHLATARLWQLYTEVYCDRGGCFVTGDLHAAVAALVRVQTGSSDISAESFLRQADEIFSKGPAQTEGVTHPEAFIRARAMKLWSEQPQSASIEIAKLIEGPPSLESLDMLAQTRAGVLTRRLIEAFLRPAWLRTEPLMAHAKLFFDDFNGAAASPDGQLALDLKDVDAKLRDYYCYVLLDFAVADRDLEEAPLAAALLLADELGLGDRFRQLAAKELNLRKKQMEALDAEASKIVERAAQDEGAES